jgi:hypothetical protein
MKLVFQTSRVGGKCRLCADIDRKRKRILKEEECTRRWKGEPAAWEMSIVKSELAIAELQKKIEEITKQRERKLSR